MADVQVKRKFGVSPQARITSYPTRPASPTKSIRSVASSSDPPRPKAKVSSSATATSGRRAASTLSPGYASGSTTPRAPSPVRRQDSQQTRLSPNLNGPTLSRMRSRDALSAVSAPTSPRAGSVKAQYASLSSATSDSALAKASPPRIRQASISSVSQLSHTSSAAPNGVCSPPLSIVSCSQDSDAQSIVSVQRIKAKVTGLAKGKPLANTQPFPSPLLQPSPLLGPSLSTPDSTSSSSPQVRHRIGRTASISSLSSSSRPQIYPITTANPAANVHRFSTARTPSNPRRPPLPFTSPLQAELKPSYTDPAHIPLPPLSPPTSSVSFSSRSSLSQSSSSSANNTAAPDINTEGNRYPEAITDQNTMNGLNARINPRSSSIIVHTVDTGIEHYEDSSEPDHDETSEEQTIRAEAKSHRKIADLEITTKSLLTINSQLEANKHRQAKEIRELRRKLRESQLALPPRVYRELKASNGVEEGDKEEDDPEEQEEVGDEEARMKAEAIELGKNDELFERVRIIIDSLLEDGKNALALKVEDVAPSKGAAKVLHEVEARSWRDGAAQGTLMPVGPEAVDDISFDETISSSDFGDEAALSKGSGKSRSYNDSSQSEREVEKLIGNLRSSLSASLES